MHAYRHNRVNLEVSCRGRLYGTAILDKASYIDDDMSMTTRSHVFSITNLPNRHFALRVELATGLTTPLLSKYPRLSTEGYHRRRSTKGKIYSTLGLPHEFTRNYFYFPTDSNSSMGGGGLMILSKSFSTKVCLR